jgi:hypothetical protein
MSSCKACSSVSVPGGRKSSGVLPVAGIHQQALKTAAGLAERGEQAMTGFKMEVRRIGSGVSGFGQREFLLTRRAEVAPELAAGFETEQMHRLAVAQPGQQFEVKARQGRDPKNANPPWPALRGRVGDFTQSGAQGRRVGPS